MQYINEVIQNLYRMDYIDEELYLGCIDSALNKEELKANHIKRIITIDIKPLNDCQPDISYLFIKANDTPSEDLLSRFEECHQFIRDGLIKGDKVLVHCMAGVSRSATIVISYIMVKYSMTSEDAINFVKKRRNIIDPNIGFRQQLILFDKMNRKVDAMNIEFRQFLCSHLRHKMLLSRPWNRPLNSSVNNGNESICEALTNHFKKLKDFMPQNMSHQKQEQIYKCKKCRLYLFNELNVLKNSISESEESEVSKVCNSVFIEPLNMMLPNINNQEMGPINCHNCFTKIGNFDWNLFICDCNLHNNLKCLMFKIDEKKVDSPPIKLTDN